MIHSSEHFTAETQLEKGAAQQHNVREAKEIREHFTEDEIDKILKDSFPASDPPA